MNRILIALLASVLTMTQADTGIAQEQSSKVAAKKDRSPDTRMILRSVVDKLSQDRKSAVEQRQAASEKLKSIRARLGKARSASEQDDAKQDSASQSEVTSLTNELWAARNEFLQAHAQINALNSVLQSLAEEVKKTPG